MRVTASLGLLGALLVSACVVPKVSYEPEAESDGSGGSPTSGSGGASSGGSGAGGSTGGTPDAAPEPMTGVVDIEAGFEHTCAALSDGRVSCWGQDEDGQVGNGRTSELSWRRPQIVSGLSDNIVQLATGQYQTCAISSAAQLYCWGWHETGLLGKGLEVGDDQHEDAAILIEGLSNVSQVAAARHNTCAVADEVLYCWGMDGTDQDTQAHGTIRFTKPLVGDGGADEGGNNLEYSPMEALIEDGGSATRVDVNDQHACATRKNSSGNEEGVYCWGENQEGMLGPITAGDRPVWNTWEAPVTDIALGVLHTCAITGDGTGTTAGDVWCWGSNGVGQLGQGDIGGGAQSTPQKVSLPEAAVQVVAASDRVCARLSSGTIYCWGRENRGEFGDGGDLETTTGTPVQVDLDEPAIDVSCGLEHTCAVLESGEARCWGLDSYGQLGIDAPDSDSYASPQVVVTF